MSSQQYMIAKKGTWQQLKVTTIRFIDEEELANLIRSFHIDYINMLARQTAAGLKNRFNFKKYLGRKLSFYYYLYKCQKSDDNKTIKVTTDELVEIAERIDIDVNR